MRVRTVLAATTLAAMTLLWTAPAALAADDDSGGSAATTTTAPEPAPAPPTTTHQQQRQQDQGGSDADQPTTTRPKPTPTEPPVTTTRPPEPRPTTQRTTPTTPSTTTTLSTPPPIPEPKASLSVSPKTVSPGDTVTAAARCENGTQVSLSGGGVDFSGDTARIDPNAAEGSHTVTLVCANGPKQVSATDSFTVSRRSTAPIAPVHARLSVSPGTVRPGDRIESGAVCEGGRIDSLTSDAARFDGTGGRVYDSAGDGNHTVTLVCANGPDRQTVTGQFRVDRSGYGEDGKATLWLSPKVVRQGDVVYANGGCDYGREVSLTGDDVIFRGDRGWVNPNAREGDHSVTRVCEIGPPPGPGPRPQYLKRVEATDHFRVIRGDGGGDGAGPRDLWLSDRSGYRGDDIDVSVRCRDDRARLESDALDDTTLRRDGWRLTGSTRVDSRASEGWHRVTVSCDGNRQSVGFWVLRDRGDHDEYLSLDPAFGHPGDSIDVRVGCDWRVGSLDSKVLDDIDLDDGNRPWRYEGTTHVVDNAEPGEHTVRVRCGDDTLEASFFVQGSDNHDGGNGDSAGGGNDVKVYPKGAPETGGGPVLADSGSSASTLTLGLTGLTGLTGAGLAGLAGSGLVRREGR